MDPIVEPVIEEVPVLISATLVDSGGVPVLDRVLSFEWMVDGLWATIEDGLTTTNDVTDDAGVADTYFVPARTLSAVLRVSFAGNDSLGSVDTTFTVPVDPSSATFQIINDLSHTRGAGIPLILVHGRSGEGQFTRWNTYLEYVRQNLSQFAEFDIYVWDHDTRKPVGFNGTSGSAQDLYESLSELSTQYPNFTPVFVAHSRGGLVVRSLMSREEPDGSRYGDRVVGVVTLGTPHHGTPLAVSDWSAAIWKEAWGSFPGAEVFFQLLVGTEGLLFETDLIGDMNLAWDNNDEAVNAQGLTSQDFEP